MFETLFINGLVFISFLAFAAKRFLTYAHAYQQEEYDSPRFISWIFSHLVFDKRLSVLIIIASFCALILPNEPILYSFILFAGFAFTAAREKDPRVVAKKKLVITQRVRRILSVAAPIVVILGLLCISLDIAPLWLVAVHIIPFTLVIVNAALQPFEDKIQQKFWDEAHDKLIEHEELKIIAITGSFGKTSVKHILGHILSMAAPTLITPGSVNTPMGIARIVREQLHDRHRYFICEMGAYGPGSIARLCRLAPPQISAVTAIGHAHYERFKTLDTVAETKYEIAEAALTNDGRCIVHENTLKFSHSKNMVNAQRDKFVIVGASEGSDFKIESISQSSEGLQVRLIYNGNHYTLGAPIFGLHHGDNIAISFALACELGLRPEDVVVALKSTPQISHRLEVKPNAINGATIIDDAYNSNPQGFKAALDALDALGRNKRRILITPGMVEMGKAHNDRHRELGSYAAARCDIAIIINAPRIQSFVDSFHKAKSGTQQIYAMKSFAEAEAWLMQNANKDDIILLENDLPDIYESVPKL